jgi:ATP-dependent protease Clp ATPase subunit
MTTEEQAELDFTKGALEQIAKECPHKETAARIRNALWQLEQRLKDHGG